MENPRKKIIINEILFWKQNKLLPEHYCDFLMTLYSEGEELQFQDELSHKKSVKAKDKRNKLAIAILISLVALLLFSLLFVITQYFFVTAIIAGIVAVIFMIYSYKFAKKYDLLAPLLQVAAALLIFGISVKISLVYFENNNVVLYSLLIANCLMWTITGIKLKLHYFTISGVLGIVLLILYQTFFL